MAEFRGIDVSEFQGTINWEKVKAAGKSFAILRCGYGRFANQVDKCFEENYRNAKTVGIQVGAYLFSYAVTVQQAKQEAENCLRIIKGKQFEYPIVYDVETPAQQRLGKKALSDIVTAFCAILEANGYYVSVYSSLNFLQNYLTAEIPKRFDIWLAQWASKPTWNGSFGMWQYDASGKVDGIQGVVDLDIAYKDYPVMIKQNGLNGYGTEENPKPTTPAVYAGKEIHLTQTKLFSSSTTSFASGRISGAYYVFSVPAVNGRYRITNKPSKVAKTPTWLFVTGWIEAAEIE